MGKIYVVTMRDGSEWGVALDVIARNRAENYKSEFGNDLQRSLDEDTLPLFDRCPNEVSDWAGNNMDWSDVEKHATRVADPAPLTSDEYREGWTNGGGHVRDTSQRAVSR